MIIHKHAFIMFIFLLIKLKQSHSPIDLKDFKQFYVEYQLFLSIFTSLAYT